MKKEKSFLDIIDFCTDKVFEGLNWISKMIRGKNTKDTIYIFTKIIVTFLVLFVLNFAFGILKYLGVNLVYLIGSTFRSILSDCLVIILNMTYIILCFVVLLKSFSSIFNNKELNLIEKDRKQDTKVKKKVFTPIISTLRVCLYICLVPIISLMGIIFVLIGMNFSLLFHGYTLISPFFMYAGILVMLYTALRVLLDIIDGRDK